MKGGFGCITWIDMVAFLISVWYFCNETLTGMVLKESNWGVSL